MIASLENIIANMLYQGMSSQSHNRLRTGTENAERSGGMEQILGSFMRGSGASGLGGGDELMHKARDFLGNDQAGGMSGAKIGGLGAAAKGGVMAVLGTLALKAWRDRQAQQGTVAPDAEPSQDEVRAMTGPVTERLVLRALIGAAQADSGIDEAEMEKTHW